MCRDSNNFQLRKMMKNIEKWYTFTVLYIHFSQIYQYLAVFARRIILQHHSQRYLHAQWSRSCFCHISWLCYDFPCIRMLCFDMFRTCALAGIAKLAPDYTSTRPQDATQCVPACCLCYYVLWCVMVCEFTIFYVSVCSHSVCKNHLKMLQTFGFHPIWTLSAAVGM